MSAAGNDGTVAAAAAESTSNTESYTIKATLKWPIADFMRQVVMIENGYSLWSPLFEVGEANSGHVFQLELFPNGDEYDTIDFVGLFLRNKSNKNDLEVKYSFSVQNANNEASYWCRIGPDNKKFTLKENAWGYGKAFSKDRIFEKSSELLPGGKLTVLCNLEIVYPAWQSEGKKVKLEFKKENTPSLSDNMATAFSDCAFPDFSIICCERTFPCHKFILSSRSDVFAAMFSHDTAENQKGKVIINDVEPDVLEQFLRFIYTDLWLLTPPTIHTNFVSDLFVLADKYNLPRLKSMCEGILCKQVQMRNVDKLLILSHLHDAKQLWKFALEFVLGHVKEFTSSPGWKSIMSHPDIMAKLFEAQAASVKK